MGNSNPNALNWCWFGTLGAGRQTFLQSSAAVTHSTTKSVERFSFWEPPENTSSLQSRSIQELLWCNWEYSVTRNYQRKHLTFWERFFSFCCQIFLATLQLPSFLSGTLESWSFKDKEEKAVMCYFGKALKLTFTYNLPIVKPNTRKFSLIYCQNAINCFKGSR